MKTKTIQSIGRTVAALINKKSYTKPLHGIIAAYHVTMDQFLAVTKQLSDEEAFSQEVTLKSTLLRDVIPQAMADAAIAVFHGVDIVCEALVIEERTTKPLITGAAALEVKAGSSTGVLSGALFDQVPDKATATLYIVVRIADGKTLTVDQLKEFLATGYTERGVPSYQGRPQINRTSALTSPTRRRE